MGTGGFGHGEQENRNGQDRTLRNRIWELLAPTDKQWNDWKWHFRNRITTVERLSEILELANDRKSQVEFVSRQYPFSITPFFLSLGVRGDPNDPILRQSVPSLEECLPIGPGYEDPLEERSHSPVLGLVHRYPDRALMVLTDICPLFCRHCTRKREWASGFWIRPMADIWRAIEYIRNTRTIRDVILSGGDPLILDNRRLRSILAALRSIPHLEMIRLGTRFLAALPQRIDGELCEILDRYGPIWVSTHFNHPNEITPEAALAARELMRAGAPLYNQSVLLKGINDNVEVQKRLSHELLKIRIRPYYLYQADEVRGTEHFRTPLETGLRIVEGLRGHTSGLGVPSFVVDVSGGGGKICLEPDPVISWREGEVVLRNYEDRTFRFRNTPTTPHLTRSTTSSPGV